MSSDITARKVYREQELLNELRTALRLFNGTDHGGIDPSGIVDVEFPNMLKAASFVEAAHLQDDATPRDPHQRSFGEPIVIQFSLLAYAMCR